MLEQEVHQPLHADGLDIRLIKLCGIHKRQSDIVHFCLIDFHSYILSIEGKLQYRKDQLPSCRNFQSIQSVLSLNLATMKSIQQPNEPKLALINSNQYSSVYAHNKTSANAECSKNKEQNLTLCFSSASQRDFDHLLIHLRFHLKVPNNIVKASLFITK